MYVRIIIFICFIAFGASLCAQDNLVSVNVNDTIQFKAGIPRTAWLLTSGPPDRRKEVRILVYGQSISAQDWWKDVKNFVEQQFPYAQITFINKAIGGFSSDQLKLTVANDVISFYPDLVLFHVYGNEADYETIIQTIRRTTTAEIAVQTDHLALQNQEWHDRHSNTWLPALCKKYGLALLDVRTAWKAYLQENNLRIEDLLTDAVHLNRDGNWLMAAIVKAYFKSISPAPYGDPYVQTLTAGKDFRIKKNRITLPFSGNRVDLVWNSGRRVNGAVNVNIDQEAPSACSCCFYYTRPALDTGSFFLRRIGQLLAMQLTDNAKEEEWRLTIKAADSVTQQVRFSLHGSITGEDGEGSSDSVFTSRSGKIVIHPVGWFRRRDRGDFAQFRWLQPGDVLHWQVKSMCHDKVAPGVHQTITVAQGLKNTKHTLELKGKGTAAIREIKIYRPPLME